MRGEKTLMTGAPPKPGDGYEVVRSMWVPGLILGQDGAAVVYEEGPDGARRCRIDPGAREEETTHWLLEHRDDYLVDVVEGI